MHCTECSYEATSTLTFTALTDPIVKHVCLTHINDVIWQHEDLFPVTVSWLTPEE